MTRTNWKEHGNPFLDFTEEMTYEWMRNGFSREECKEWLDIGMKVSDSGFCAWLRDIKEITLEDWNLNHGKIKDQPKSIFVVCSICSKLNDLWRLWKRNKLEKEYEENLQDSKISEEVIEQIKDFERSWNHETQTYYTKEQISLIDKLIPNKVLKKWYKKYGLCKECRQLNTNFEWCKPCSQQDFSQITSGNKKVDEFIRLQQLLATDENETLSWIPFEQLEEIKYLAEGGFGKIYKAKWNKDNKQVEKIALKILNNSQDISLEFLTEINNNKLVAGGAIVPCHGISQDPSTKNYLIVMHYMREGNLRQYLQEKNTELSLQDKLYKLHFVARGLNIIHYKNLLHRDFHPGNILNDINNVSYLADLGLCRPVSEVGNENIYGVMPYIAPEALRNKPYTQASDIYSFGIVAYELFANAYPYLELDDLHLALKVCQGLRPNIDDVLIPKLLKDLIKRCWDSDPTKRPSAGELSETLWNWFNEINNKKETEFTQQIQATKGYNQFSQNTPYQIDLKAILTSKMIDTKKISELSQKIEKNNISKSIEFDLEEVDNYLKEYKEQEVRIEISPKN